MMSKNEASALQSLFSEIQKAIDGGSVQMFQLGEDGGLTPVNDVLNDFGKYIGIPKIAYIAGLSRSHRKKMLKVILKNTIASLAIRYDASVVDSFGRLLTLRDACAEQLYDVFMYLDLCVGKLKGKNVNLDDFQHRLSTMSAMLGKFVSEFSELEYNDVVKRFLQVLGVTTERVLVECFLYFAHPLIIEWFSRGVQASGLSATHFSVLDSIDLSLCELDVMLKMLSPRYDNVFSGYFNDKDRKSAESAFKVLNGEKAFNQFKSIVSKDEDSSILDNLERKVFPSALSYLFNNDVRPNLAAHCFNLSTADVKRTAKFAMKFFGKTADILKKRKFFIRERGVSVWLTKSLVGVSNICIKEIHESDRHLIWIQYLMDIGHYREFYLDIENINVVHLQATTWQDYIVLLWVLYWIGLQNEMEQNVREQDNDADQLLKKTYNFLGCLAEDSNLVYEDPEGWNYECKSRPAKQKGDKQSIGKKQVTVGRYVRRLPNGAKASEEAKAYAKQFCLELEDGYTFVNEFTRMQDIKRAL